MTVLIMNDEETPISTKKVKVVVAICIGIPPISSKWLIDCESHNAFLPTESYQIKDAILDFSLSNSIQLRTTAQLTGGVLNGCGVFIATGVCSKEGMPTKDVFHFLVKTSGGTILKTQQLVKFDASRLIIISNSTLSQQLIELCERGAIAVNGTSFLHAIKIQQLQLTSNQPPVMHSSFNAKTSLGVDTLQIKTPTRKTNVGADDKVKITTSCKSLSPVVLDPRSTIEESVVNPSESTSTNFHDTFLSDRARSVKKLFGERSNSITAKLIADKDKDVRVIIPVKRVVRSVSSHREGVFDVGAVKMVDVGDGGTLCVHENPQDHIRLLSYRDGNGEKLFISQDLNRFIHPSNVIKGNGGKEPVFYMGAVNRLACHFRRYIFEFDSVAVLAYALGHIFYDNMAHLSEFFVQDDRNRFLGSSTSVPDHYVESEESGMDIDYEVDEAPYVDPRYKGQSQY